MHNCSSRNSVFLFFFFTSSIIFFLLPSKPSSHPPPRLKRSLSCWQGHEKAAGSLCLECLQVINSASSYPQPFSSAKWLNALALNGKPLLMPLAQTSPFAPLSRSIATSQILLSKSAKIYIWVERFIGRKWGHYFGYLGVVVYLMASLRDPFPCKSKKIFGFH